MKNIQCNFLLIGNPNTGKSTFFSVMTGKNAQIGNRPGVTVDSQKATFDKKRGWTIEDLPGIYYLDSEYHAQALDQQVTLSRLNDIEINDFIINIIDCRLLRRNLYLTLQLIEFQHPMILVLNFNDDPLLPAFLEETLGLNVLTWAQAQDSDQLKKAIEDPKRIPQPNHLPISSQLNNHFEQRQHLTQNKLLTWDIAQRSELREFTQHLQNVTGSADAETALATIRYKFIDESHISGRLKNFDAFSENIDRVVMHRYAGIPVFLIIMYTTFWLTIVFGGALTTVIESLIEIPFLYCTQFINQYFLLLFISSLGIGIQTLASFIVPIFILYSILGFLEQSGYMQRAALVIDKLMQYLKLPGQSFVPIIVGFGCNVPAIMSSRTLDYERDRIQTILMSPFMSCSARLAIFTVFANSFFGTQGYKIIFALYVFGFMIAILTGLVVRYSMGVAHSSPLLQEIVSYRLPHMKSLTKAAWFRMQSFLSKAASVILPITIIIHTLIHSGIGFNEPAQRMIVKIFEPIGLETRDWPAALSLFSGLLAKEVVIGTLEAFNDPMTPHTVIKQDLMTIGKNQLIEAYAGIKNISFLPFSSQEVVSSNALKGLFANQHAAISYLIFVLLYFPCISVTTAIARESRSFWAVFSVIWSTSLAYISAMLYYQLNTRALSFLGFMMIMGACLLYFSILIYLLKRKIKADKKTKIPFVLKSQFVF